MEIEQKLIEIIQDANVPSSIRMNGLHWLCEAYADDPKIWQIVNPELGGEMFSEFPILAYFPVPAEALEQVFDRTEELLKQASVNGRASLTDPRMRCAGKLMEHVVLLPTKYLVEHYSRIQHITSLSKIFFRIDLDELKLRIELQELTADELARKLEESIMKLSEADNLYYEQLSVASVDTLRQLYPDYLELSNSIRLKPPSEGHLAVSFNTVMKSLVRTPEPGLESILGGHLQDDRESVFVPALEALVRLRTDVAAHALIELFGSSGEQQQRWIARGLQRMNTSGLHPQIIQLITTVRKGSGTWRMLLIALARQLSKETAPQMAQMLSDLAGSEAQDITRNMQVYLAAIGEHTDLEREFDAFTKRKAPAKNVDRAALREQLARNLRDNLN